MKKKTVVAVILLSIFLVTGFVLCFGPSRIDIPDKELVYLQLQLDGKDEEFVLSQLEGCSRTNLIEEWGDPDGTLSGFYGDIWTITENDAIIVYYSAESEVEHIKLLQNDNQDNSSLR